MRYFYSTGHLASEMYGYRDACNHPLCVSYTVFDFPSGIGFGVVQKRFDPEAKCWYYGSLDPGLANDIYLNDKFPEYFKKAAAPRNEKGDYPIYEVRKVMWALRMKPLKREYWENEEF